jgi:oxalate decarboxylase/phosphoglucose isomerase-like protein (cupin superfamily)
MTSAITTPTAIMLASVLSLGMIGATFSSVSAQGQEEMNEALQNLREAKSTLEHASKNKGGHRENAIHLVDQAIAEVEAGKAYAKQHGNDKDEHHHDHDNDHDHD